MNKLWGIEVVQVYLNGMGPYAFVLDTGASITLVKKSLLRELKIPTFGAVTIAASLGESEHQRAVLDRITLAGVGAEHVEIDCIEGRELGGIESKVDGVLGENFLKHFDVLIDNERQVLVLDRASSLARMLRGERLGLLYAGSFHGEATSDRVIVPLKIPGLRNQEFYFLLDSGANTAMLYPDRDGASFISLSTAHGLIHSLNQDQRCGLRPTTLAIGGQSYPETKVVSCEGMTREEADSDGLLPSSIFRRIFICHSLGYVIPNPKDR